MPSDRHPVPKPRAPRPSKRPRLQASPKPRPTVSSALVRVTTSKPVPRSKATVLTVTQRAASQLATATRTGCLAIDGEGYTTRNGEHLYCYIAAGNADGSFFLDDYDPNGMSTARIFDFLLALPRDMLKIGFALGYDYTKWFEHLEDGEIFRLLRPDQRAHETTGRPADVLVPHIRNRLSNAIECFETTAINLISTRLTLRRGQHLEAMPSIEGAESRSRIRWSESVTIWDFFKFFGRAFVPSLIDWDVGDRATLERIQKMKDRRGKFASIGKGEKEYCKLEVAHLAQMGDKLLASIKEAGIRLTAYFGPGSVAGAMLDECDAKNARPNIPPEMEDPVQRAFFGGRFEINCCGPILPCEGDDLASAYPSAETSIPCFRHGRWRLVTKNIEETVRRAALRGAALCHYRLPQHPAIDVVEVPDPDILMGMGNAPPIDRLAYAPNTAWGAFPFRLKDGSIVFPATSGGGWIWHHEMLAALDHPKLWPNVELREAWVFEPDCECPPPFLETVTRDYCKRLEWGKEGKGMAMKLGLNSRYGKRAQSIGQAPYRCLVTAGLITSHCRGQILHAIGAAEDPWDVLSTATDGILANKMLKLPEATAPCTRLTEGAARAAAEREGKPRYPLGAWEHISYPEGVFLIRPGMRFALDVKRDPDKKKEAAKIKKTAARGLGVRVLHQNRQKVLALWKKKPHTPLTLQQKAVFWGAKICVSLGKTAPQRVFWHGPTEPRRNPRYGLWITPEPYNVSYAPMPKRPLLLKNNRILSWALLDFDLESSAYDKSKSDALPANEELRQAQDMADAQPDGLTGLVGDDAP